MREAEELHANQRRVMARRARIMILAGLSMFILGVAFFATGGLTDASGRALSGAIGCTAFGGVILGLGLWQAIRWFGSAN